MKKILFLSFLLVKFAHAISCISGTAGLFYDNSANSTNDCGTGNMTTTGSLTHGVATCGGYPFEASGFNDSNFDTSSSGLNTGFTSTLFTVECYLYTTSLPHSDNVAVSWINGGGINRIDILANGAVAFQTNSGSFLTTAAGKVPLSTCVNVAVVWDGTHRLIYVNNVSSASDSTNGAGSTVTTIIVGRDQAAGSIFFPGIISGLRFSTVVRTSFPTTDTVSSVSKDPSRTNTKTKE